MVNFILIWVNIIKFVRCYVFTQLNCLWTFAENKHTEMWRSISEFSNSVQAHLFVSVPKINMAEIQVLKFDKYINHI